MKSINKRAVFAVLVLMLVLGMPLPAFAASVTDAVRNPDGSVTVTWSGDEQGKTLTIQRKSGIGYDDIAEVQQVDGSYTDRTADPDETLYYRLHYGVGKFTPDAEVRPYNPPPSEQPAPGRPEQPVKDEGGMLERAIAGVLNGGIVLIEGLEKMAGFKTFDELVFNINNGNKEILPFTAGEWDAAHQWYAGMAAGAGMLVLIAVFLTALKLMFSAVNPAERSEAMESIWRWVWAVFIIAGAPLLIWAVFQINVALVDTFLEVAAGIQGNNVSDLAQLTSTGRGFLKNLQTGSVLGTAIVKLAFLVLGLYINVLYIVRKYVLFVLFVFTPLMAWLWAVNKNVNASAVWLGELLSNAFMQASHALVFLIFMTLVDFKNLGNGTWLTALVMLAAVIPVSEMLRNSLQGLFARMSGVDESGVARTAMGVFGLSSIAGLGAVAGTLRPRAPLPPWKKDPSSAPSGTSSGAGSFGGREVSPPPAPPPAAPGPAGASPAGAGASFSAGAAALSPGYRQSPSGLIVPAGAASAPVKPPLPGTLSPASTPGGMTGAVLRGERAGLAGANAGRVIGGAAGGMIAAPIRNYGGGFLKAPVRAGATLAGAVAGRGLATGYGMAKEVYGKMKKDNVSVGEAIKDVTGSRSAAGGIGRAAAVTAATAVHAGMGKRMANRFKPASVTTLDNRVD
jgi:hypothetical protein